ncbi:MAG: CrcB family protein [Ktedonobacteraceae bacterium]|nr:CrcB family protein [Ktedonobacteraceae bacterium]
MGITLSARRRILAVFAGGFCGAIARALLSMLIQSRLGNGWPYDILLINLTGAFLIAFFTTLADTTFLIGPTRRLFINVGFLGAYTTFSSLALGDVLQFQKGHWFPGLLYLAISIIGGILLVQVGVLFGQFCVKHLKSSNKTMLTDTYIDIQDDVLLPDDNEPATQPSTHQTGQLS